MSSVETQTRKHHHHALLSAPSLPLSPLPRPPPPPKTNQPTTTILTPPLQKSRFLLYEEHAASLQICTSIAGPSSTHCAGSPAETAGRSGKAEFVLAATERARGATINVTKERWMRCVSAAREMCPEGAFEGVCVGAATRGDVWFELRSV
jgi:hypothetical protein